MREGFWASHSDGGVLPWPTPQLDWLERNPFLKILDEISARADKTAYRGFSYCRLCGCRNGHEEFSLGGWQWPSGYRHYIALHGVRPSPEFEEFVFSNAL